MGKVNASYLGLPYNFPYVFDQFRSRERMSGCSQEFPARTCTHGKPFRSYRRLPYRALEVEKFTSDVNVSSHVK